MDEYIDRKALLRTRPDIENWGGPYGYSISAIKQFPAADVAPVRHGKWIRHGDWSECSLCGESGTSHIKYCPNCGAKMDGEVKE